MLGAILGALGTIGGSLINRSVAKDQMHEQQRFAQQGIQWKVADATKAGLHPLAALGANTMSYTPVQVGDMAGPLADMGQNIGRAVSAASTDKQRTGNALLTGLQMERAGLENDLLRSQIASENAKLRAQVGPPMPALRPEILKDPTRTAGINAGVGYPTNPYFSDGQTLEDRYGDFWGSVLSSAVPPADLYWNLPKGTDFHSGRPVPRNSGYPRFGGSRPN